MALGLSVKEVMHYHYMCSRLGDKGDVKVLTEGFSSVISCAFLFFLIGG